ncbi:sulfate transporter subunit; periplasmic-binding component of ABC superfamily [Rubrivivax sp. A210]|uniref:sulfate ABC transporter substrate-binding protein n=1 Tax=Rubrivivax sp. A210 TaxID=2772301 RepID=UPI0019B3D8E9|nr:sulfate ABC transporter substrate-binding protein [Rubrivivax sp. A210]CAD5373979.1 sulfate transporter subunit; periplasmic-binding component of ABC superfamily [Rubrivivax sp. A210]
MSLNRRHVLLPAVLSIAALFGAAPVQAAGQTLLNVSYDVSREFYKDYNSAFAAHWKKTTGEEVTLNQSHGGSSRQARSVADGLEADVITMNQHNDIDVLVTRGALLPADWAKRLPHNASPTTSISVILVRKGNPKNIRDWSDLGKPGLSVIIPNPKTSGNGRYTYLAAWGAAVTGGVSPEAAKALVTRIFANVPVLDGGGRGATTTFAQRNLGDALVTFESEVPLIEREFGAHYEVVYPSRSILAENPVSVVDKVADKRGTRKLAEAYLQYLYSDAGQEIAARYNLRPRSPKVLAKYAKAFPKVNTFTVDEVFGGWSKAQKEHFNDGALYDQVIAAAKAR